MSTSNVDATLTERGTRYGEFIDHSRYAQDLKRAMQRVPANWHKLSDDKKEALEMVVHKIGRILNGDPEYIDSWHDIIGYVRLVEKNLEAAQQKVGEIEYMTATELAARIEKDRLSSSQPAPNPHYYVNDPAELRPTIAEHFCAGTQRLAVGHAVECEACKTAIYGPRAL